MSNHKNLTPELPCSPTASSTVSQKVVFTKARPVLLLWMQTPKNFKFPWKLVYHPILQAKKTD